MKTSFIAASLVLALAAVPIANAKVLSSGGRMEYTHWVASNETATTNTGSYVNVPDMAVGFTTRKRGSIHIQYCANTFAKGTAIIHKQVIMNGKKVFPKGIQFNAENPTFNEANCFTWVARNRAAGNYQIHVQHRSSGSGVLVTTNKRSLTVRHR